MAEDDDVPGRSNANQMNESIGVMHEQQRQQQRRYKGIPKADDQALPPSSSPIDLPEPVTSRRHRASSRCKSFGRPSPHFKTQRSVDDDTAPAPQGSPSHLGRLVSQIQEWIDHETVKNEKRDSHSSHKFELQLSLEKLQQILHHGFDLNDDSSSPKHAAAATTSQTTDANLVTQRPHGKRSSLSLLKLGRVPTCSSDTENEIDRLPPAADVVLDNSKTLSYPSASTTDLSRRSTNAGAWLAFKTEIVRLAHTLKLKGWRRVPLENGADIEVKRLSGALTNAVYVVTPPSNLSEPQTTEPSIPRPTPSKLLLRIYGPQVEHLIDRQSELAILRRLARKNIGPKLLGTFRNGRFEQFFNAKTLTANDIRDATTSRQIAKRMRELHVGIKLLPEEREAGPFVWQNWDKWKERCEEVIEWLDSQIKSQTDSNKALSLHRGEAWRTRGLVCGVEWKVFRTAVRAYRTWLEGKYGGSSQIQDSLVFAHNDTQYGNLLRLMPDDKASPLLQPANQHRRLVVIDFEYSNANTPGLEFANHFTEWCYNYHSSEPHLCVTDAYPKLDEQRRFIKTYVSHVPHFSARTPGATPVLAATSSPSIGPSQSPFSRPQLRGSVSSFMLDSRAHPGGSGSQGLSSSFGSLGGGGSWLNNRTYEEEEKAREDILENEVTRLMTETRLWRVANSAQWVAWGIVQAKVPGMEEALAAQREARRKEKTERENLDENTDVRVDSGRFDIREGYRDGNNASGAGDDDHLSQLYHDTVTEPKPPSGKYNSAEGSDNDGEDEEFDYLAYAQDRALFFWGDVLKLGLVREDELPPELVANAKRIDY